MSTRKITMIDDMEPNLRKALEQAHVGFIIALINRNGGSITMSIKELDASSGLLEWDFSGTDVTVRVRSIVAPTGRIGPVTQDDPNTNTNTNTH